MPSAGRWFGIVGIREAGGSWTRRGRGPLVQPIDRAPIRSYPHVAFCVRRRVWRSLAALKRRMTRRVSGCELKPSFAVIARFSAPGGGSAIDQETPSTWRRSRAHVPKACARPEGAGRNEASLKAAYGAGVMLVGCRPAGLSALGAHYAGVK